MMAATLFTWGCGGGDDKDDDTGGGSSGTTIKEGWYIPEGFISQRLKIPSFRYCTFLIFAVPLPSKTAKIL